MNAASQPALAGSAPAKRVAQSGARRILTELRPQVWPLACWVIAYDAMRLAAEKMFLAEDGLSTESALDEVMQWIARAQDAHGSGGIAAYYSLYGGWAVPYPETTGYLIPTLLDHAHATRNARWKERAARAADWLLTLQDKDGAFPGGFATASDGPSVFNSGQILNGLVAISAEDIKYLQSATRCGDWLCKMQSADGAWRTSTYEGRTHVYYTMVAWAMARLALLTGNDQYAAAARRNVEFAIAQQRAQDAWIAGYGLGKRSNFLHFIAYTLQGMLEVGLIQKNDAFVAAARRSTDRLVQHLQRTRSMPGAFADGWSPHAHYGCMTGNVQLAIVCFGLFEVTGERDYLTTARRLTAIVKNTIWVQGPAGVRGAVKGSDPTWGRYLTFRYPNWAAKFAADAFRLELKYTEASA